MYIFPCCALRPKRGSISMPTQRRVEPSRVFVRRWMRDGIRNDHYVWTQAFMLCILCVMTQTHTPAALHSHSRNQILPNKTAYIHLCPKRQHEIYKSESRAFSSSSLLVCFVVRCIQLYVLVLASVCVCVCVAYGAAGRPCSIAHNIHITHALVCISGFFSASYSSSLFSSRCIQCSGSSFSHDSLSATLKNPTPNDGFVGVQCTPSGAPFGPLTEHTHRTEKMQCRWLTTQCIFVLHVSVWVSARQRR